MERKAKYTFEQKVQACEDYLSGKKGAKHIAQELSKGKQGHGLIRLWSKMYQTNGPNILKVTQHNQSYSKEFKKEVVETYLSGAMSLPDIQAKYGIRSVKQILSWISKYNSHGCSISGHSLL